MKRAGMTMRNRKSIRAQFVQLRRSPEIFVAVCFLLIGCDSESREVNRYYSMTTVDIGGRYWLVENGKFIHGTGVVDGSIVFIGWNDGLVWVLRKWSRGGVVDGWMVASPGKVSGPYRVDTLAIVLRNQGYFGKVWSVPAATAWSMVE